MSLNGLLAFGTCKCLLPAWGCLYLGAKHLKLQLGCLVWKSYEATSGTVLLV